MHTRTPSPTGILLREVAPGDLPYFFEHQLDRTANHLAAFTSKDPADRAAFMARWSRLLAEPTIICRTIVLHDPEPRIVGHISKFEIEGEPELTYWLAREHWNKGIATAALALFLREIAIRPLHARAASDNFASLRILQKCGFTITGRQRGFANARNQEIEETLLTLQ